MSIKSFKYSEFKDSDRYWDFKGSDFLDFNLIVGKNSTGKTRLVNTVNSLLRILAGSQKEAFEEGNFNANINLDGSDYKFQIEFRGSKVVSENLFVNGKEMMTRDGSGAGRIYYVEKDEFIPFQIEKEALAIQQRADALQHPYVSKLAAWARGARFYSFGSSFANNMVAIVNNASPNIPRKNDDGENIVRTYISGFERFGEDFDKAIRQDMKKIGYNLTDVGAGDVAELGLKHTSTQVLFGIFASERGIPVRLLSTTMSQGMYRALGLIISMNFARFSGDHTCIVIDDIGEGLDYDRSVELLKVIRYHSIRSNFQVIMTTNDRFIMNKVPLENWIILNRRKSIVKAFTERNSPKKFSEFKFMGLSNFDFFTSTVFR